MSTINIRNNLAAVRQRIEAIADRCGRSGNEIRLIAVSKTRSVEEVRLAVEAGQRDFGENTMQDAMTKIPTLEASDAQWHFIGHLQSKKARQVPGNFQWVHSIDSIKLAEKLSDAMADTEFDASINCLVQVNVAAEESKSGVKSAELLSFVDELLHRQLPHINWRGLMTIGVQADEYRTRSAFAGLRHLLNQCQYEFGLSTFDQLSMGMSDDYAIAIEEGATMLRLGTAIFGERRGK